MTEKLLLNVDEAAHLLGCRRTYLYGMIQRGELPVVKLGRLTRVPVSEVEEFIRKQVFLQGGDLESNGTDQVPFADGRIGHSLRRAGLSGSSPCMTPRAGPG